MKLRLAFFVALLFLVPVGLAFVPEGFDSETAGELPEDPRYTYTKDGTTSEVSTTRSYTGGQSFKHNSGAAGSGDYFDWTGYNLCDSGAVFSARVHLDTAAGVGGFPGRSIRPVVAFGDQSATDVITFMWDQESDGRIGYNLDLASSYPKNSGSFIGITDTDVDGIDAADGWLHFTWKNADCSASTMDLVVVVENGTEVINASLSSLSLPASLDRTWLGWNGVGEVVSSSPVYYDNIGWDEEIDFEADLAPDAPASISAVVTEADEGPGTGSVLLRWRLSANDPDQDAGAFNYYYYRDGFTGIQVLDAVSGGDGAGIREVLITVDGSGTHTYQVRGQNPDSGTYGASSCVIVVDWSVQFSQDSCGPNPPGLSGLGGGTGVIPGVDTEQLATDLGLELNVFNWLIGLGIVAGLGAAAFRLMGPVGAAGGALAGVAASTAFGLFPIWFILVLSLFLAAALFLRRGA